MDILTSIAQAAQAVRDKVPLVHHITNYVTVNDCANAVLAIGASPIMSDDIAECADITAIYIPATKLAQENGIGKLANLIITITKALACADRHLPSPGGEYGYLKPAHHSKHDRFRQAGQ